MKKKKKNKSNTNEGTDDDDDDEGGYDMSNEKVLNWPVGNKNNSEVHSVPPKKHRKGCQKKQNAQL